MNGAVVVDFWSITMMLLVYVGVPLLLWRAATRPHRKPWLRRVLLTFTAACVLMLVWGLIDFYRFDSLS
jgi:peptidoglycan/LPS O-acetylase OafA/YrhL